jgi:hypothetical protein
MPEASSGTSSLNFPEIALLAIEFSPIDRDVRG